MTRDELIKQLQENLKPDAEMDFLFISRSGCKFLDVKDVTMNQDVDDPNNYHRGGIVFIDKEEWN